MCLQPFPLLLHGEIFTPIWPVTQADIQGVEVVCGINVTYKGHGTQGTLGMATPLTPGALSHILQPLKHKIQMLISGLS